MGLLDILRKCFLPRPNGDIEAINKELDIAANTEADIPAENELSTWGYRVFKRTTNLREWFGKQGQPFPEFMPETEDTYAIHSAHYDKQGFIHAMSEDPTYPQGETLEELKTDIARYIDAINQSVLDYDKIPEAGALPIATITVKDLNKVAKTAAEIIEESKTHEGHCCGHKHE